MPRLASTGGEDDGPIAACGPGLLTAAIAGAVLTSPGVGAVLAAIRAAAGRRGAVLVVKNYTGDRLKFGLAAELPRAAGHPAEVVAVADDVALRDTLPPGRRRGIAGRVLVHKTAGAAAAEGRPLAEVAAAARGAAAALGSMGVALGACTVPAAGRPGFKIGPAEIELGLGIHGEQGVARAAPQPADALVERRTITGRPWACVRDDRPSAGPAPPAAVFFRSRDRAAEHPDRHLPGYAGVPQADAYAGLNAPYRPERKPGPVAEAGCCSTWHSSPGHRLPSPHSPSSGQERSPPVASEPPDPRPSPEGYSAE